MKNDLFQIGEVTKALGITRRILINYENFGLITPIIKNEGQKFRFYSADDIVHIKLIRSLQQLGLSLTEIHNYFENTEYLDTEIERLVQLRNQLDQYIALLRLRQTAIDREEIHHVTLSSFTACCREFHNADLTRKTVELRQTIIDVIKHNNLDIKNKICMHISISSNTDGYYIVPVQADSFDKNVQKFPREEAICMYYRGPYEGFPAVYDKLLQYAYDNQMTPCGYFRNIYMEGPPTHGTNKNAYMTQICLLIKSISSKKYT